MHDLNQIIAANEKAFFGEIAAKHRQGLTVVGTYTGVHLVEIEGFLDPAQAEGRAGQPGESPDVHRRLFPLPPGGAAGPRDQSEDR